MQIGIALPNMLPGVQPAVLPQWAAQSEQAGFSTLGSVGRIAYPGVIDTVALAAAAAVTSTIGLFSTVMLAPTWPPVLMAKETASIDAISGGRLTLGLAVGSRPDDFADDELRFSGRGKRLDRDLAIYRDVWRGKPIGGGPNPGVMAGAREIPLLFGGFAPGSLQRMARWGEGYIGAAMPAPMIAAAFQAARDAWTKEARAGSPRLVAVTYYAFGDVDRARGNVWDYYSISGAGLADTIASGIHTGREGVKDAVAAFAEIGTDELLFAPALADLEEISRLADAIR